MSANERRIAEANECIQRAQNHLKTSIWKLKTKPEYDLAASEYERAAVCYRNAERLDLCKDAYVKAAECHASSGNHFHEAKAKENAAMACKDAKDFDGAVKLFEDCAEQYMLSGSIDTAVMTIEKAGKILENGYPQKAVELYEKGLLMVQQSERAKMANTLATRLVKLYLAEENYTKALETLSTLVEVYKETKEFGKIGQIVLGMVLIELAKGDSIAALKSLYHLPEAEITSYGAEMSAAKCLINAYEKFDEKAFKEVLGNGIFRSMDNEYLRLMKKLKVPEHEGELADAPHSSSAGNGDEEEDEEDLR